MLKNNSIKKLYKLFSKIDYIMISNREVKRSFKVILDSYNTNSYTGTQFNANYYVDLVRLISDEEAFNKQYNVYCEFITRPDSTTNNDINIGFNYTLSLIFNNNPNQTYQYEQSKSYSFLLPISNVYDTNVPPASHTLLRLDDNNQKPLFMQNIRNLTNIKLQVYKINAGSQAIFNPSIPDNSKYICNLTFVEA